MRSGASTTATSCRATLLHVVDYVGGLAAGAFDASGALVGFVFGMNGIRDGDLVHWSHMLGVRESARNSGLGRMLKEYQRTTLRDIGVKRIYWTFDPLMSKNAYFNINRLGAEIVEYVPDMYGRTSSPLHLGLPTDRLIACLPTSPREGVPRAVPDARTPVLTAFPKLDDHTVSVRDHAPETALIEIPARHPRRARAITRYGADVAPRSARSFPVGAVARLCGDGRASRRGGESVVLRRQRRSFGPSVSACVRGRPVDPERSEGPRPRVTIPR